MRSFTIPVLCAESHLFLVTLASTGEAEPGSAAKQPGEEQPGKPRANPTTAYLYR